MIDEGSEPIHNFSSESQAITLKFSDQEISTIINISSIAFQFPTNLPVPLPLRKM